MTTPLSASGSLDRLGTDHYARWVRVAILVALAGYLVALLANLVFFHMEDRVRALLTQGSVVAACAVAWVIASRGRVRLAAGITLGAIWFELHTGIPTYGLSPNALVVFPVLVSGGGILLGGRAAYVMAGLTSVTLFLGGSTIGWAPWGSGPTMVNPAYLYLITCVAMFVSAALVHLGVDSFARVLASAQASEGRLAYLLENAPDGVLATDGRERVVSLNPAAERILGVGRAEMLGRRVGQVMEEACVDDEGVSRVRDLLARPMKTERSVFFRAGDGGHRSVDLVVAPITWADGSVGHQVTLRDLTELRQAWDRERMLRVQLEHAQRLEAVGRIAGGVAHEFNNLLTVVGGAAELLLQEREGRGGEDLARDILEAKTRGASLTRQLLAFARKDLARPVRLSLERVVRGLEPLLRSTVPEKVALTLRIPPAVVDVIADQGQVEQILVNLVLNARDALKGAGRIEVGLAGPGTRLAWQGGEPWTVPEGFVEFWVEDTGPGMEAEVVERVFEPFFTTKPRGEGTGLGLSTVHGIVTQNQGVVRVHSRPGGGTRVSVRWPATREM